jgi:hypothetical protein
MSTNASIILLSLATVSVTASSSAQRGKPPDTAVIVVLPCAPSQPCANGARLTGDDVGNVYQTSSTKGVNAILFGNDGNLSLQFQAVGKKNNKEYKRKILLDSTYFVPDSGPGTPVPASGVIEPDYLFAAPDDGTGINCDIAANNCGGVGSLGTVTSSWDKVRLMYRFNATVSGGTEKRYWTLSFSDVNEGRYAEVECLQGTASRCDVWKILPDSSNVATLTSRGTGTDVQETGEFGVPTEIIVCRSSEVDVSECAGHLSS